MEEQGDGVGQAPSLSEAHHFLKENFYKNNNSSALTQNIGRYELSLWIRHVSLMCYKFYHTSSIDTDTRDRQGLQCTDTVCYIGIILS